MKQSYQLKCSEVLEAKELKIVLEECFLEYFKSLKQQEKLKKEPLK